MAQTVETFSMAMPASELLERAKTFVASVIEAGYCTQINLTVRSPFQSVVRNGIANTADATKILDEAIQHYSTRKNQGIGDLSLTCTIKPNVSPTIKIIPEALWTKIEVTSGQQLTTDVIDSFRKSFPQVDRANTVIKHIPDEQRAIIEAQQSALSSMQTRTAELQDVVQDLTKKQAEYIQELTQNLTNQFAERETTLQGKVEEERAEIRTFKERVEQKESELNLRENRGVRRELLKNIKDDILAENTFSFSKSTFKKSLLVHILCFAGMAIGIALACTFIVPLAMGSFESAGTEMTPIADEGAAAAAPHKIQFSWFHFAPFPTGLALFGSTLVFYIRWASRWFKNHAESELSNLQYGKDILRASWIAELVFESAANKVDGKTEPVEIPPFLLEQFCANLFQYADRGNPTHPFDDLQKYAKKFRKFTIGAKGIEVEADGDLDKKGK